MFSKNLFVRCFIIKYLVFWSVMIFLGVFLWYVLIVDLCLFSNRGRGFNCIFVEDFLCIFSVCVCWRNLGYINNIG